jgi:hypothetical protein
MARVRMVELVEALSPQLRAALDEALTANLPADTPVDRQKLFRDFRRILAVRCKPWERVPDSVVDDG